MSSLGKKENKIFDSDNKRIINTDRATEKEGSSFLNAPSISLPKGGGAIRGIGEKFTVNPATGTASFNVPLYTSPGRSGFGPQLSLTYDSGSGNGPFGFGWSLSMPSITRNTAKGIPQYQDGVESDVFILSGAEDLVPVLVKVGKTWQHENPKRRDIDGVIYTIKRYRPRLEGLFARIEQWTNTETGKIHWRSISKDNVTTFYGKTKESQIYDPQDTGRIFSWLICESHDDKGNAILYQYKPENFQRVDLTSVNERNRTDTSRSANRHIKRIKYGNKSPYITTEKLSDRKDWMFEVVFDYGEHYFENKLSHEPLKVFINENDTERAWKIRQDPFSTYRSGFEIRTYRLCQRVLMFHHFPDELGVSDYLVKSTEFTFTEDPMASFIGSASQSGFILKKDGKYLKKSFPPLEFEYSQATINDKIQEIDKESLENLPSGLDGTRYQWIDLDGEGLAGILTEQAEAWFYKHNLGSLPISPGKAVTGDGDGIDSKADSAIVARFAPLQIEKSIPSFSDLNNGRHQLIDLQGDGVIELVKFDKFISGYFKRSQNEKWDNFVPFSSLPNIGWEDPNLKFIDLTGDGHADILITEDKVFSWYQSLAEKGFKNAAQKVHQSLDEEKGPCLVFADGTQSIFLADMSGDGLTDLVRIRNGEVCYWPNLGYGKFGTKVTMDNSPWFDNPEQFDHARVRLADIDGSGTTDIIYLGRDGIDIFRNECGNRIKELHRLNTQFPHIDSLSTSIMVLDLLGNGTACLVWSSSLPSDGSRIMYYIDLMGGQKPHLLVSVKNNLGTETRWLYTPSTRFYLEDKYAGKPWITRIPFPVHVVERVETFDLISRNRFVSRYAYHHGYFDGIEREFRGFGMVEQWDTEEFAALTNSDVFPIGDNIDASSYVPPVYTKTWFHTGIYFDRNHISNYMAGLIDANDKGEYYRESSLPDGDVKAREQLLDDTVLPEGFLLTVKEEFEACRALKGMMLRQEVYAKDDTNKEQYPYSVTEQNFTIKMLQPLGDNNDHAVFFSHPRETINYHYERNPDDPRTSHMMTLEVDNFGNVLKQVSIGYGRRKPDPDLLLKLPKDSDNQTKPLITYNENAFTDSLDMDDIYRGPMPSETSTYELTDYPLTDSLGRYKHVDFVIPDSDPSKPGRLMHVYQVEIDYHDLPSGSRQRRLIERVRILYRTDDLTALLELGKLASPELGKLASLAIPGETYKLAFTPGLLTQIFIYNDKQLIPDPVKTLGSKGANGGGYVSSQQLKTEGKFPKTDLDNHWWIPSGRVFLSPNSLDIPLQELAYASSHFFLPHRYRDPFHTDSLNTESFVNYDSYDLLLVETQDALGNRVTVGERLPDDTVNVTKPGNDYRVLQPWRIMDPNRNRTQISFDVFGMTSGTAVMGKPEEMVGDSLDGFEADLTQDQIDEFYSATDPHIPSTALLRGASTRIIYDFTRFQRTQQTYPDDYSKWEPPFVALLARETHKNESIPTDVLKVQISFAYSDGFGREIQKKIQSEPGPLIKGGAVVSPRWIGSGWIIYNNKGKPICKYEPFFSDTHRFVFDPIIGVSSTLFYDPIGRIIAVFHPNNTYEKVVFNPWKQISYDVNDTETSDPRTDDDIRNYTAEYFKIHPDIWQTWHEQRITGEKGVQEKSAAEKAQKHANTPTTIYLDTLGRPYLTVLHNKFDRIRSDGVIEIMEQRYATRVRLDIEGNQREVYDSILPDSIVPIEDKEGRIVLRSYYDMLGTQIHRQSMEAGTQWILNDVTGRPIHIWKNPPRQETDVIQIFDIEYDELRRPFRSYVTGFDPGNFTRKILYERIIYGEQHPEARTRNLRGKVYLQCDEAGVVTSEQFDFKGNIIQSTRNLAKEYRQSIDWTSVNLTIPLDSKTPLTLSKIEASLSLLLENEGKEFFSSKTWYDALNRPIQIIVPHSNKSTRINVIRHSYNENNLLDKVYVWLEQPSEPTTLLNESTGTQYVSNIDYNAKGQRVFMEYGMDDMNRVWTTYDYDENTFHLINIKTKRKRIGHPEEEYLQDLTYTYDPVGNIIHIQDNAQTEIFVKGRWVEPSNDYTYDAVYRLKQATGREHLGIGLSTPEDPANDTSDPRNGSILTDPNNLGTYNEMYTYDPVGNITEIGHVGMDPSNPGWTRNYSYNEQSLIEEGKKNNGLSFTEIRNRGIRFDYNHDLHGNIIYMPHFDHTRFLSLNMHWNFKDNLQKIDLGGGGTSYYVYDLKGQRVRKVIEREGSFIEERIYISNFEVFRKRIGSGLPLVLERETLHIMDDQKRIAMVETRTLDLNNVDKSPRQLIRYQLSNHLDSTSLELDTEAKIISYEEYYPYGGTSYWAMRNRTEGYKRYRYTGKERDEENGFYYYGARYYIPWIGRWANCDPFGTIDSINLFIYAANNPIKFVDPDGNKIEFANGSSPKFKKQFMDTLATLKEDLKGSDLVKYLDYLENSEHTILIEENLGEFSAENQTLSWAPLLGVVDKYSGNKLPPALALFHEAVHAYRFYSIIDAARDKGYPGTWGALKNYLSNLSPNESHFENKEEEYVITGPEQEAAEIMHYTKKGIPFRTSHIGNEYIATDPFDRTGVQQKPGRVNYDVLSLIDQWQIDRERAKTESLKSEPERKGSLPLIPFSPGKYKSLVVRRFMETGALQRFMETGAPIDNTDYKYFESQFHRNRIESNYRILDHYLEKRYPVFMRDLREHEIVI